ncbi:MAG: cation-transporting P-type ATPase [Candidatus Omnitrophica bacterium]|nr:cation-transporting P-type ATPase [Candidatus Omnitrophota bacterium]
MYTLLGKHWHHLPTEEVVQILEVDLNRGLDRFEIENRRAHFGANLLKGKKGKSPFVRFILQFHQPLIYILLAAAIVTALFKGTVDAAVILAVVIINAVIGFAQEAKAVQAIEALAKTVITQATVLRSGEKCVISSDQIVPGDVVYLQSGDKVPADVRLIEVNNLQTEEASLTGESAPVQKSQETLPQETLLADRQNIAYASTLVTFGQARGLVIATGHQTEVGRISELLEATDELQTPLTKKIERFSHILLYWILGLTGVTFAIGILRGQEMVQTFIAAVALAVAAIPEGLPAVVTITLAIGVNRMAKKGSLIRKLPAVETLGSTTVICSDKTGTLTENQMTVTEVFAGGEFYQLTGSGYQPEGEVLSSAGAPLDDASLRECMMAGLLCNDSQLVNEGGLWKAQGDPTEVALIVSAAKARIQKSELDAHTKRLDSIPFESQYQYMAVVTEDTQKHSKNVYVKGAVEKILERCELSKAAREKALANQQQMAERGLRVLAFAKMGVRDADFRLNHDSISSGLSFIGLQGMIDPPRAEAISAVAVCQSAGIDIKMITGDHVVTAHAIAAELGLGRPSKEGKRIVALTGSQLEKLNDAGLIDCVEETSVFARVTPEQKLRIVEALQARGHVVAMTGDGVNDAPALKRADIGIAMGISGTEVAKEAADMILTDDNFSTIEKAIEEGRGVFDNLKKFIAWILPTNLGQGLVIFAAILTGLPLPILPVQILWINMTTAIFLGLSLAFEAKEPDIMNKPPRDPSAALLSPDMLIRLFTVGVALMAGAFGLFELAIWMGGNVEAARTVSVGVFVWGQLFYLLNCRSLDKSILEIGIFSNLWIWVGIGAMLLAHALYAYLPPMNYLFHSHPVGWVGWAKGFGVGLAIYALVGLEKKLRKSMQLRRA